MLPGYEFLRSVCARFWEPYFGEESCLYPCEDHEGRAIRQYQEFNAVVGEDSKRNQVLSVPGLLDGDSFQVVGKGGFGLVFRAFLYDGQAVAVKIASVKTVALQRAVARELAAMSRLSNHRHVAELHGWSFSPCLGGMVMILMPLYEGGCLRTCIYHSPRDGGMHHFDAAAVCSQVLLAVHTIHSAGYAHRDLKPDNILLESSPTDDGRLTAPTVIVADLGAAHELGPNFEVPGGGQHYKELVTTLGYYGDEIRDQSSSGGASTDMFAVGVILFEMLTRTHPLVAYDATGRVISSSSARRGGWDSTPEFQALPFAAKDLIRNLLAPCHLDRLSAAEALVHPFISPHVSAEITTALQLKPHRAHHCSRGGAEREIPPAHDCFTGGAGCREEVCVSETSTASMITCSSSSSRSSRGRNGNNYSNRGASNRRRRRRITGGLVSFSPSLLAGGGGGFSSSTASAAGRPLSKEGIADADSRAVAQFVDQPRRRRSDRVLQLQLRRRRRCGRRRAVGSKWWWRGSSSHSNSSNNNSSSRTDCGRARIIRWSLGGVTLWGVACGSETATATTAIKRTRRISVAATACNGDVGGFRSPGRCARGYILVVVLLLLLMSA